MKSIHVQRREWHDYHDRDKNNYEYVANDAAPKD